MTAHVRPFIFINVHFYLLKQYKHVSEKIISEVTTSLNEKK